MTAGSVILEDDGSGGFTERHIPKTPTELNAGGGSASAAWPVGAVFISVVATNPHDLFGFGTWASFGAGRVLVGQNPSDTDFDVAEETGGSKTNTPAGTVSQPTFTGSAVTSGSNSGSAVKVGTSSAGAAPSGHNHSVTAAGTVSQPNFTGSAMSVVQPYIVVYMWKRTA